MLGSAPRLTLSAGAIHTGFVGEDHGLHPVAEFELHQDAFDVGSDGRFLDDECRGDLAVGQASGDEFEDLPFAWGQLVESGLVAEFGVGCSACGR